MGRLDCAALVLLAFGHDLCALLQCLHGIKRHRFACLTENGGLVVHADCHWRGVAGRLVLGIARDDVRMLLIGIWADPNHSDFRALCHQRIDLLCRLRLSLRVPIAGRLLRGS